MKGGTKKKKSRMVMGYGEPKTIEITYLPGAPVVDSMERAIEVLTAVEQAKKDIRPILDFIEQGKVHAQSYAVTHAVDVIQLENCYYRKIKRHSRMWVTRPEGMPKPKPKGAKSVLEIVADKTVKVNGKRKKVWNLITTRTVDPVKIDKAVRKGWVKQSEIDKAYLEIPGNPFIQRFEGVASKGEDDDD